jgi:hypothetical protein
MNGSGTTDGADSVRWEKRDTEKNKNGKKKNKLG